NDGCICCPSLAYPCCAELILQPPLKCPVAVPDKFSGQPEMFQAFQGQCQLFMAMRPEDFPDDRARVGFVISLLSSSAAQWAMPLLTQDSPFPPHMVI
uniref:DUF4939 domain-containing protein n=1 Tax=Naja naja TaxID=35670 RepID=A0A8C6XM20_NAJNA